MKILLGRDIRCADLYTIENEPVASLDLMERASVALTGAIVDLCEGPGAVDGVPEYLVFAGKGNNAGDAMAVARLLYGRLGSERRITILMAFPEGELSEDCRANFDRLPDGVGRLRFCGMEEVRDSEGAAVEMGEVFDSEGNAVDLASLFRRNTVIVDGLLGTGVSGEVREPVRSAIRMMNAFKGGCAKVVAIDMPSGLPTEPSGSFCGDGVVRADVTLTIEFPKLSLLLPQTGPFAGRLKVIPIGLDKGFVGRAESSYQAVDAAMVRAMLRPRGEFDHKGTHGHALLIAGSTGMMGAAVLCCQAALRSGCGLVTAHVPFGERAVIHAAAPSAIVYSAGTSASGASDTSGVLDASGTSGASGVSDGHTCFCEVPTGLSRYTAIAVGPGLGRNEETVSALRDLLCALKEWSGTLVLDADALNIISANPQMLGLIPKGSILTPHIGELSRLLRAASKGIGSGPEASESGTLRSGTSGSEVSASGASGSGDSESGTSEQGYPWSDDLDKIAMVRALSRRLGSVIVVKGAHTMVCSPDGMCRFNMTGNPGMAKGGSGDVLTGLVAGLAARGYEALEAALLGVWYHGAAGDRAAGAYGLESMNASDIVANIRLD